MDNLLWLERLEAQAAVVIQRMYRGHLKAKFWKQYLRETKGALAFQIAWRRYWTRKVAKKQKAMFDMFATKVQAAERGRVERRKTMSMKQQMHEAASDIQRVFRGWFWRRKAKLRTRKRQHAKIARMWRGAKGRAIADRRFLDVKATIIQRTIRGSVGGRARKFFIPPCRRLTHPTFHSTCSWLARKKYKVKRRNGSDACTRVQALFRGWSQRRRYHKRLWDESCAAITAWLALLKAEEIFLDEEVRAKIAHKTSHNVEVTLEARAAEWRLLESAVAEQELDYMSLVNERVKLSPEVRGGARASAPFAKSAALTTPFSTHTSPRPRTTGGRRSWTATLRRRARTSRSSRRARSSPSRASRATCARPRRSSTRRLRS